MLLSSHQPQLIAQRSPRDHVLPFNLPSPPPPHGISSGEEERVTAKAAGAGRQAEEGRARMEAARRAEKRVREEAEAEAARKKEKEVFWRKEEEEAAAVARLKEDVEGKRRQLEARRAHKLKEQEVLFCYNTTPIACLCLRPTVMYVHTHTDRHTDTHTHTTFGVVRCN